MPLREEGAPIKGLVQTVLVMMSPSLWDLRLSAAAHWFLVYVDCADRRCCWGPQGTPSADQRASVTLSVLGYPHPSRAQWGLSRTAATSASATV